jgi:hypothetical protein
MPEPLAVDGRRLEGDAGQTRGLGGGRVVRALRDINVRFRVVLFINFVTQIVAWWGPWSKSRSARFEIMGGGIALMAIVIAVGQRAARAAGLDKLPPAVCLPDMPRLVRMVREAGGEGAFAVLSFGKNGAAPAEQDALNVQFSVENGRVGLDWVLVSPLNVAEETAVRAFFNREGRPVETRSKNGVSYLRTEEGDLAALCEILLARLFGVTAEQKLTLMAEGVSSRGKFILEATQVTSSNPLA